MTGSRIACEFKAVDYVHPDSYNKPEELIRIRTIVEKKIGYRPGFGGISFSDVNANGIQINISHLRAGHMEGGTNVTLRYQAVGHKSRETPDFLKGWGCPSYDVEGAISALIEWWNTRGEEISAKNPCDHDYKVIRSRMCLVEYECTKCGFYSCIDSSD